MDDTERRAQDHPTTRSTLGRRALFSRALLLAGAAVTLTGLTGCPGGEQGDDGEDDEGGDDD